MPLATGTQRRFTVKIRPVKAIPIGLALLAALFVAPGCSRDIGDSCSTSVDCDPNGTRSCDLSQPGGYCTIVGCTETSCPSGSACIRVFPTQFLVTTCTPDCEDIPPCSLTCPDPANCSPPLCPPTCLNLPTPGPTNDCAADEVCLAQENNQGLCARRSLEQRYCAKNCGNNGDCRSGYVCRGTGDSTMALSSTPNVTTNFCAPALSP